MGTKTLQVEISLGKKTPKLEGVFEDNVLRPLTEFSEEERAVLRSGAQEIKIGEEYYRKIQGRDKAEVLPGAGPIRHISYRKFN